MSKERLCLQLYTTLHVQTRARKRDETSVDFSSGSLRQRSWKSPSSVQKSERKDASGASASPRGEAVVSSDASAEPSAPEEPDVPAFSGIPSASLGSGTYTCPPASRNTHVSDTLEPRCVAKASPRGRQSDQDGLTGLRVDRHGELRQSAGMRHAGWHLHLHDHAPFHVWGKPHLMSKEPAQQLVSTSGVEISAAQTAMPP